MFDSTIFCFSRSRYYEEARHFLDGSYLRASLYTWAITTLTNDGNDILTDMECQYIEYRDMLSNSDGMDEDEIKVIREAHSLLEYIQYMQNHTQEYALEYDLQLLAKFLCIRIHIFTPDEGNNDFEINNTKTVSFLTEIFPYNEENYTKQ